MMADPIVMDVLVDGETPIGGDVSIQNRVGVDSIFHDDSMFGTGKKDDPLGVNRGLFMLSSGGTLTGRIDFNPEAGTVGVNKALIGVQTADGLKPLFGAKTDDNGVLRDVAVIPKLEGDSLNFNNIYAGIIGNIVNPVNRIHVKKITSSGITEAITIPDKAGTMARIEDIDEVVGDISTALTAILGE